MARGVNLSVAVASGGALGAVARYLCSVGMIAMLGPDFPWGTLSVNVIGSFLIGVYVALTAQGRQTAAMRHFVTTGFCGGFTTFSIFSLETLHLARTDEFALAGLYVGGSVLLWLTSVWLGYGIGRRLNA